MSEILTSRQRLAAFDLLGQALIDPDEHLQQLINSAKQYNAWFTPESTARAVQALAHMLNRSDLEQWMSSYGLNTAADDQNEVKSVGLILAGNIPLVGFHDLLCVLATGNKALIKLSSQDKLLIPYIIKRLTEIEPWFGDKVEFVEKLNDFDAVIATGSNNSSRYFEYYFSKVPHIIRKNRNSIAILSGKESAEELQELGHDIFDYFGLGCRNVSKIYVPRHYEFAHLFEGIESFKRVLEHHKYNNNYDYNKSIYLVNQDKHLDNGFLLVREDERMASPLAVLYYQRYDDRRMLEMELSELSDQIQCIVSGEPSGLDSVGFGFTQSPKLWDYADGIDTVAFLKSINTNS
jgi:hypothetical protein